MDEELKGKGKGGSKGKRASTSPEQRVAKAIARMTMDQLDALAVAVSTTTPRNAEYLAQCIHDVKKAG